jgi:diguanylate cyclase (GGDEF)-like protein
VAADKPDAPEADNLAVAQTTLLLAEIERLKAEIARAERIIAELEARADIDPLLDIRNRRGFERELKRSISYIDRYGAEAAVLFIDLDDFKSINDRHGHGAGDEVLKAMAAALVGNVRASDVVARLGGDEFAVLLWNLGEARATAKARELEKIIGAISLTHGATQIPISASAGIAPLRPNLDPAQVLDAADRSMYARKKERKKARRLKSISAEGG